MSRWARNLVLPISLVVTLSGIVLTVPSWGWAYDVFNARSGWLATYEPLATYGSGKYGDVNLIPMILGPILLLFGGFYLGEQIVLRRKFKRLFSTQKKSEFLSRKKELEKIASRLPRSYRKRIEEKEEEFRSKRGG